MADDWKIHRDRRTCERPGCPLPTSRTYIAVLQWPGCVRSDLCDACFVEHERRCPPGEPPIFWRAQRRAAGSKEPALDLASLRALFDRLGAVDDDRARALRYFCALLLLRKRVLRLVAPRTAEHERADLVVADPKQKDAPPVALFAPAIDPGDLGGLKDELLAAIGEAAAAPGEDAGD
jgi:hypothetical protein